MIRPLRPVRPLVPLLALAPLLLAGCATRYESASLSGGAMMRIDVEVYKGPLSIPVSGQIGQMGAVVSESIRAAAQWHEASVKLAMATYAAHPPYRANFSDEALERASSVPELARTAQVRDAGDRLVNFENMMCVNAGVGSAGLPAAINRQDCAALQDAITIARQVILSGCNLIAQKDFILLLGKPTYVPVQTCSDYGYLTIEEPRKTVRQQYNEIHKREGNAERLYTEEGIKGQLEKDAGVITIAVDNYAALLRSAGFRTAFSNVRYVPQDRTVRSAIIGFGFVNAEYGNQIQGRIAVLTKQISASPTSARLLPTADYLRDSSNTRFLQLAEWLDGDGDRFGLPNPGRLDVEDRVRLAQSLTNDYYWQNVSTVYGSGRGKTGMAFIKDDIGNWDLKSFTSDPTELLAAYRDVTSAALKSAVKLATSAAAPGAKALGAAGEKLSVARSLRDLATQVASPESGDGGSAEQTARLRTRLVNDLNDLKKQFADAPAKRKKDADEKEIILNDKKNTEANEKSALENRQGELTVAKKAYDDCDKNIDCSALNTAYLKAVTDKAAAEKSLATAEQARIEAEKANDAAKLALANIEKDARAALAAQLDRQADIIAALELLAVPPEPAKPAAEAAATTGTTPP